MKRRIILKSKRIFLITLMMSVALLCSTSLVYKNEISNYYGYSIAAITNWGSSGQEVIDVQAKLYNWGYYKDVVDGVYGYNTYQAIKKFQSKNGLTVDGIAGPETLAALGLNQYVPSSSNGGNSTVSRDVDLLAHIIHGEARGEPYIGQVAIAAVVLNRIRDGRFPKTIAGVIYQPGAFDAVDDGQINLQPSQTSYTAARDALNGWDPTYGCIYYYNPSTATSKWIWTRQIMLQIGKHNFAR
jgi:N-acetylmuramoyl-L-alanine amidase